MPSILSHRNTLARCGKLRSQGQVARSKPKMPDNLFQWFSLILLGLPYITPVLSTVINHRSVTELTVLCLCRGCRIRNWRQVSMRKAASDCKG